MGPSFERRLPRLRAFLTRGLTIFVFHEITDTPSEFQLRGGGYTTLGAFAAQLEWIGARFEFVAPVDLPHLGGERPLPDRAALITFDDAWAGMFRAGLPILAVRDIPALCFINMATINGDPDLSAVRRYEERTLPREQRRLEATADADTGPRLLTEIRERYRSDAAFTAFQGPTASIEDLRRGAGRGRVWFGSHLHHHWDTTRVTSDLLALSLRDNATALAEFDNTLPALATPYGADVTLPGTSGEELGIRTVFVAHGGQNRVVSSRVLDRVALEPEPSGPPEWWYATHRRRLFGHLAS